MTLKDRIKNLCKLKKIPVSKLEDDLGFAGGYISKLDKSSPNTDKINAIAKYLNVSLDYLMGNVDFVICPICGFADDPLSDQSRKEHDKFHSKYLNVKEKYPFFMKYSEASRIKDESIDIFRNRHKSIDERLDAFDNYLKAAFSLEISNHNYDIEHLDFNQFCKVEVSTLEEDWVITEEFIDLLADKYGIDKNFLNGNEQILARASNNNQLMRILAYAEKLNPEMLDTLEVQIKALADNRIKG